MLRDQNTFLNDRADELSNPTQHVQARRNAPYPSVICHIVPPYILRRLSQNGTPSQRAAASQTLSLDLTFRTLRVMHAMTPKAPTRLVALGAEPEAHVTLCDAQNTENLPGRVVREQGAPATGDAAVDEAYDGLGNVFRFYQEKFDRNSVDDQGMHLDGTVHFGDHYDNAFWNGERMVFGDGDLDLFNRFTISIDIIGHELTHGVTEDEARLIYLYQAGALNESISDVFGSLVKQFVVNQTAEQADWLIGQGLFTPKVHGVALRSMKAPGNAFDDPILGKDPQPADMRHYVQTQEDNGGVHINSGIPNHAFYLVASSLKGYAWEKAGRIWYATLRDSKLRPTSGFRAFAGLTVNNARTIYGAKSVEEKAVVDAWAQVGIKVK